MRACAAILLYSQPAVRGPAACPEGRRAACCLQVRELEEVEDERQAYYEARTAAAPAIFCLAWWQDAADGAPAQGVQANHVAITTQLNAYEAEVARDKRQAAAMAEANRKRMAALQAELDAAAQSRCAACAVQIRPLRRARRGRPAA